VLAAAVAGASPGRTMQFDLRPEQIKRMALTATQAKTIAAYKNVAVLTSVPNKPWVRGPGDACSEIEAINDWDFKKQIEEHTSRVVSSRFNVVAVTYNGDALVGNYTPREALPMDAGVDAFIIVEGRLVFWHTAEMKVDSMMGMGYVAYALSDLLTKHEPEYAFTSFSLQIIDAKTKKRSSRFRTMAKTPALSGGRIGMSEAWARKSGRKARGSAAVR
jgi:hypothetical protein